MKMNRPAVKRLKQLAAPRFILAGAAMMALASAQSAHAVNSTWKGSVTDGDWATSGNWSGAMASGNALIFTSANASTSGTLTNSLTTSSYQIAGITFNSGSPSYTFTGNTFALTGDITNNSTSTQTLGAGMVLTNANRNVTTVTGGTTVITGVVSQDATARRLQAQGLGTLILNGSAASTYTGQTSVAQQGTFVVDLSNISGHSNLINTASNLNLGNGNGSEGGTIIIKGAASGGTSSQTFAGLTLGAHTAGSIIVNANGGSGTSLNLGTSVTRATAASGVVTFDISSLNSNLNGTTLGLTAGTQTASQAVAGWALVKDATGTGFAANVGTATVRYTGATALAAGGSALTTTAANNYSLAAGGVTTSLATTQTVNSLNINTAGSAGVLDLGAGALTVSTGGIIANGNSRLTIQSGQLGATNSDVIIHAIGTGGVTINSNISGGTGSFVKAGADTVTLLGSNSYSGDTAVTGTLKAGSSTAFSANSNYYVSAVAGSALDLGGFDVSVGNLQTSNVATTAGVNLGSNTLTVGAKNADGLWGGNISGAGNVTKVGSGIWTLQFVANTYTGATTINGGTIRTRIVNAMGVNSAVTVGSAGILDLYDLNQTIGSLAGSGSVTNGQTTAGTATLTIGGDNTSTTFSGALSNSATNPSTVILALTKTGTGTQTLSGINTYTGVTNVNAGTLLATKATALAGYNTASSVVFNGGIVGVQVGGSGWATGEVDTLLTNATKTSGALGIDTTNGDLTQWTPFTTTNFGSTIGLAKLGAGNLTLNSANTYAGPTTISRGTLILGSAGTLGTSGTYANTIANNGAFTYSSSAAQVLTGVMSGTGSVTMGSTGQLNISGNNTFSGGMTMNSGTLGVGNNNALGSGTFTYNGGTLDAVNVTGTGAVNLASTSAAVFNADVSFGTATTGANQLSFAGPITLGGTRTFTVNSGGGTLNLVTTGTNSISDGGNNYGLTKAGPGLMRIGGANTFTGDTKSVGGTLVIWSNLALQNSAYDTSGGGGFTISGGSTTTPTFGGLKGSGAMNFGNFIATVTEFKLNPGSGVTNTYGGVITGTNGMALTMVGQGTQIFTGVNNYTGATTINSGRLTISSGNINSTSGVSIGAGEFKYNSTTAFSKNVSFSGTGGKLSGTGTITNAVSITSGNTLAPGNSPGTLNTGAMTFNGGGIYQWEINNATGTKGIDQGWDWANITGTLNITATNVNKFIVDITGLTTGNVAGAVVNWNPATNFTWTIATASGGITGFSSDEFTLQKTNFTSGGNSVTGTFSITTSGNDLQLVYTAPITNNSALSLSPTNLTIKGFVAGTAGTSSTLTNTQTAGASTTYTTTPSNGGISASAGGTLAASGTTGVAVNLVNNASGSATSGNKNYTVTVANTGNVADTGGAKTLSITANIYQEALLSGSATAATQSTTSALSLTNAASTDSGQRAGISVTSVTASNSATGRSSNFVAPVAGSTVIGDTTTSGSTIAIGTVALQGKRLNGSYSETVTAAAQYTDLTLRGQANITSQPYTVTASISGNTSTSRTDIYSADILSGHSFNGYGLTSGVGSGKAGPTVATLLGGTAGADRTVNMSFSSTLGVVGTDSINRQSDILTLSGINISDTFVLQMSYDPNASAGDKYIVVFSTTLHRWVNAISGDSDHVLDASSFLDGGQGIGHYVLGNYNSSYTLGYYGYNDSTKTAWAVLDNTNGAEFAVVPEPSAWAMLVGGFGLLICIQRARRNRVGAW